MHEASAVGLLKTLAIIILIYYGLKILTRYLFPLIIKRTVNKMEDRFKEQQQAQQPQGKVGETSIDKKPISKQKESSKGGEYIDYEELE